MKNLRSLFALGLILAATISCSISQKYISKRLDPPENANSKSRTTNTYESSENIDSISDETLLQTLIDVENEWKKAKISGSANILNRIFADEFTNTIQDGRTYTKAQWVKYLSDGKSNIKSFKITDARIVVRMKDSATISFRITTVYDDKEISTDVLKDTDKFVFRDGRWQVISSVSIEETQKQKL